MSWNRIGKFYFGVVCGVALSAGVVWILFSTLMVRLGGDLGPVVPIAFEPGQRGYEIQLERGMPEFWEQLSGDLTIEAQRYCGERGLDGLSVEVVAQGDHTEFRLIVDTSGQIELSDLGQIDLLKSHLRGNVSKWFYDYLDDPVGD